MKYVKEIEIKQKRNRNEDYYNYLAENARGFGINFSPVVFDLSISSSIIQE